MTYTLFMPADQRIQIAEDGVAEVPMTDARAALTRLIRGVREDGRPGAFTERGERRAYVVTPAMFDRVQGASEKERAFSELVHKLDALFQDKQFAERVAKKDPELHELLEAGTLHLLL
ncbi:type II toxin-antitoxin system prevent-host-death family antitoxin [Streptomyces sp. ActVer]|uniref:type II toxin-antitoxin system prevent-host-death family antitoxin n=1 Tax=Streptomyces sp. ActVer TaxID=3014558 RepID=UPI0022B50643|nr:type II toxin-antitoxin system prevent-host-death family antitoxin [Streptomyces sp. ActVer]MCZ4509940.1 type II toxin-antitoxin system prevent-host-death family antitoxin [Streptomyces sp. ActVer]